MMPHVSTLASLNITICPRKIGQIPPQFHSSQEHDELVIDAEKASTQNQAHVPSSIGHKAVEIVYHVLLLLHVVPVIDGEREERLRGAALRVDFARWRDVIVAQGNLVLFAGRQTAGHFIDDGVTSLLQLLGYVGQSVNLDGNAGFVNIRGNTNWPFLPKLYKTLQFTIEEILLVSNYWQMNYHPETLKSKKVCPEQVLPLEYLPCNRSCPQRSCRCTPWCWESLIRCSSNVATVCLGNSSGSTWRRTDVISSLWCPCKCFRKRLCDLAQTSVTGN